jgi:hypothetical protein
MTSDIAFRPGWKPVEPALLSRYLPPIPIGIGTDWLQENIPPGSWVLDPFGASPQLAVEAAKAGYRVLVAANNPVARFLLELASQPPSEADLRTALAQLSATRKGPERLEPHIRNLYLTECAQCGQEIMAEAFLWQRNATSPFARIYSCPYCGDKGERPATPLDASRAARFSSGGLHRARALERIAPPNDPDRAHAEEALSAYLPRAVYAIFTLINKLEGFSLTPEVHHPLAAILLHACDQADTLWPYPIARARPRQITIPPQFRENNLWLSLEEAIEIIASSNPSIPLTFWPERPSIKRGITIYEGRLRDLIQQESSIFDPGSPDELKLQGLITALPRPNQAFWTLSALWAGWLWGRESAGPFKSVLRRRRYDWAWHASALYSTIKALVPLLSEEIPYLALIGEAEPGFLSSAIIAFETAHLKLQGIALRAEEDQAQMVWSYSKAVDGESNKSDDLGRKLPDLAATTGRQYLLERAEPASYLHLHTAALKKISEEHLLTHGQEYSIIDLYSKIQEAFEQAFTYRRGFLRYSGSEKSLEVGRWWLQDFDDLYKKTEPLSDRVENQVVHYLESHPGCKFYEIDEALCKQLPGLLTPDIELVQTCLTSYGEKIEGENDQWKLREQDFTEYRHDEIVSMRRLLSDLGNQLDFEIQHENPILWLDENGIISYVFYVIESATIGRIVFINPYPPQKSLIVFPGSRAAIAAYHLRNDAHLSEIINRGWRFLKFRHLRRLAESTSLTRENFDDQLTLDPITETAPQMRLL